MQIITRYAVLILAYVLTTCSPPGLDLNVEIERPTSLRCGEPSIDNVCADDIAHIFARSAETLIIYQGDNTVLLSCPSNDPRCMPFNKSIYQLNKSGYIYIKAKLKSDERMIMLDVQP